MKTILDDGSRSFGLDELLSEFNARIVVLSDLAEAAVPAGDDSIAAALERGISNLRDDWELFEKAVRALPEESHLLIAEVIR